MKIFLSIILLVTVILAGAFILAPQLRAQEGELFLPSINKTAQTDSVTNQGGPPNPVPPGRQVEIVAPLPLPVDASISGSVEVNNFPATQNVAGTVNVANLPPAREPVQISVFYGCNTNGFGCGTDVYTVPSGKRLVIEYVSMIIGSVTQPDTVAPRIRTELGGNFVEHELGVTSEITNVGGFANIVIGQNVKLYADPGTVVRGSFRREKGISQFGYDLSVKISGYLETVP